MKVRNGFVSNSSSASFIVVANTTLDNFCNSMADMEFDVFSYEKVIEYAKFWLKRQESSLDDYRNPEQLERYFWWTSDYVTEQIAECEEEIKKINEILPRHYVDDQIGLIPWYEVDHVTFFEKYNREQRKELIKFFLKKSHIWTKEENGLTTFEQHITMYNSDADWSELIKTIIFWFVVNKIQFTTSISNDN